MPRRENEERKSTFLFRDYRLYGYSASAKCNRNLLLPSAYSYFGCAEDTPARQCSNKFDIALAYSYFGCAEDTPARQCSNKFDIALAYSYFGCALDTRARQCSNKFDIALAYSYLCTQIIRNHHDHENRIQTLCRRADRTGHPRGYRRRRPHFALLHPRRRAGAYAPAVQAA